MQAVEFWEKSAQEAMDGGLDPAAALKWFARADELAETLSTYFRRNRPMSVWMIPRPEGLNEGRADGTAPGATASAPMQLGPLPPSQIQDLSAPPLSGDASYARLCSNICKHVHIVSGIVPCFAALASCWMA